MKRLISLIMCFLMLVLSGVPALAENSISDDKNNIDLLYLINAVDKKDFTADELSSYVTRADFLLYVAKTLGMSENVEFNENYFTDLDLHWATNLVNKFADMKVISVPEDGKFNPDREITINEAIKILVSVLGYDELAKVNGGYPTGYMLLANRLKITYSDVDKLTLSDAFNMLTSYIHAPMYQIEKIKNDTVYYEQNEDTTILSVYHLISYDEGYVSGVDSHTFDDTSDGIDVMYVADKKYQLDENFEYPYGFIGSYVRVYYDNTHNKNLTAKLCVELENLSVFEINASDVDYLDEDYRLWYFKDGDDKAYSKKLDRGIKVLYNGYLNTDSITTMFDNLKNGKIRLVDADENGYFEYAAITDYTDFVVSQVDSENKIIYDMLSSMAIDLNKYDFSGIYNEEYQPQDISTIKEGTILSVAKSSDEKTYVEIVISDDYISGTAEEMLSENDRTLLKINGEFYEVSADYLKKNKVKAGIKGKFYLNIFDKITFIDTDASKDYHYGFITKGERARDINPNAIGLEMFSDDSTFKIHYIEENIYVDGYKCKKLDDVLDALGANSNDEISPMVIRYKLNNDGVITHIDTTLNVNEGYEQETDSIVNTLPKDDSTSSADAQRIFAMSTNVKRIGTDLLFNNKTILFFIPALTDIKNGDYHSYDFEVAQFADMISDTGVNAEGYKSDTKAVCEELVVCYGKNTSLGSYYDDSTNLMVVKGVKQAVDSEGFNAPKVYGLRGGGEEGYFVSDDYINTFNKMKISEGDLLAIGTDNQGKINDIHLLYDFSQGGEPKAQTGSKWFDSNRYLNNHTNFSVKFSCSFMYAGYKEGNLIKCVYNTSQNFIKDSSESVDVTNKKIIVIDKNKTDGNKVYFGSVLDINDADSVGINNASKLFVHYRYLTTKDIIVYK